MYIVAGGARSITYKQSWGEGGGRKERIKRLFATEKKERIQKDKEQKMEEIKKRRV